MAPRIHLLEVDQFLPAPLEEVFPFFAEARNLEALTPPWLKFHVLTPEPILMSRGARIEYRLRIRGFPVGWESEITAWEPPHRFVDEQRRGPYRIWIHEHTFEREGTGTRTRDRIQYAAPGGELVRRFLVEPDVRVIFSYRRRILAERFPGPSGQQPASLL